MRRRPAGGRAGKTKVSVNGIPVDVAREKKSLAVLGKNELENEKIPMWSLLSRFVFAYYFSWLAY